MSYPTSLDSHTPIPYLCRARLQPAGRRTPILAGVLARPHGLLQANCSNHDTPESYLILEPPEPKEFPRYWRYSRLRSLARTRFPASFCPL